MLKRWLKKIRQKPKESRDSLASTIAGLFTLVVVTVWIFNLPERGSAIFENSDTNDEESINIFADMLKNISEQTSEIRETLELESALQTDSGTSTISSDSDTSAADSPTTTSSVLENKNSSSSAKEVHLQIIYSSSSVNNATTSGE